VTSYFSLFSEHQKKIFKTNFRSFEMKIPIKQGVSWKSSALSMFWDKVSVFKSKMFTKSSLVV
jgi:hypothetical protein